ncbi:gliding motility-associated ABC transporter ATP-binding subunit GldA [Neolewinella agarilytica]|uniref:Protein involved in gliding motility GldA n=1 Tax=Neolewinella agarilytica TaxID=478744 RepID=A0A1H8YZN1_9BACT|nr:gliding motility-associated ABC transporter ATP-binding subunit GldA [Neolewinella agarilytica]SEP57552.1 protein involved in gliding motility GldA [Neolewinella agarilytica]
MSVSVNKLTKLYGEQRALDEISFKANPGGILGFLGPNGAGKTTTMKILTCYLSQTSGSATVCGHDVTTDSLAVRKLVGYLPEHNPLYKDMYLREYLAFAAGANRVENAKSRIKELIEVTGLGRESHKRIGALSKGYRQRVGLAQAMLHDPKVLILDEPTSGLDPNQLAEIRSLIKKLGQEKTVIFSTHIMQEVQALCDRVIIIDRGKLVADDPIEKLKRRLSGDRSLLVAFDKLADPQKLRSIPGVARVETNPEGFSYRLYLDAKADPRAEVFRFAVQNELVLLGMQAEDLSVEEVFRALTNSNAGSKATV